MTAASITDQWVEDWMASREPRYTVWQNICAIFGRAS